MGAIPGTASIGILSPGEGPTNGPDRLVILGLIEGPSDMGSKTYLLGTNVSATFSHSTLAFVSGSGNTIIRATVAGTCTGACGGLTASSGTLTYVPSATLKDVIGNAPAGTFVTPPTFVCF